MELVLLNPSKLRSVDIIRSIRREIYKKNIKLLKVYSTTDIITKIINYRRTEITSLEKQFNIRIFFYIDSNLKGSNFYITACNNFAEEDVIAIQDDIEITSLPQNKTKVKKHPKVKTNKKNQQNKNFIKDFIGKIYR